MVKAPSVAPTGTPAGVRRIHPGPEIAMNPRNLPTASASMPPAMRGDANAVGRTTPVYHPQVDVSTQVDLHSGFGGPGVMDSWDRRATPLYSREDIKEQYCITSRQLDAVEKSGGGFFGCLSTRGPSPCSSTRNSILSACVRSVPSDENLCDAPYPRRPLQIMYRQPYPTYSRGLSRYDLEEEADWIESSYFRRRPRSFCTVPDPKRYTWVPEDEESMKLEGPRPVLPPIPPPPASVTTMQITQAPKAKHVSFARSHTLTSFEVPRNISPPRPHNPERLIDSQPTMQNVILPSSLPLTHPYPGVEPRVLVLEKPPKRGAMKTQATQTELPPMFRGRILPVTLSPRTIHRVKMVSQGAQTNGVFNGRKLTKSYSEAGQLGTPLGSQGAPAKEESEHEPLHRTQSEEPPRSPFLISTTPPPIPSVTTVVVEETLPNGDIALVPIGICHQHHRKSLDIDDQEIFINFKPAPVSPDARALLSRISEPTRRFLPLQKTFSDGEIRVERRELIGESSEPSYPHTCRRNQQDPWGRTVRAPVQFSSTPEDLSLLRSLSPPEDNHEEEFHENLIRRGLFRKRSVSLEDGVQGLSSDDFMLPRSLPTSPTSPTAAATTRRISQTPKDDSLPTCALLHTAVYPPTYSTGTGITGANIIGQVTSPFASSDSLTNDVTRDHSDGIWNESQATVLQADSLALLTPSSRRRHLLLLQHQQRSSMDTEALDVEDELEPCPPSPRIRLEPATPVQPLTPRRSYRIQDLLPVQFQQIYYNDVSTAHFYAYDIIESSISNGRPRSGLRRASPCPPLSQPQSQSSSEFGLSLARTDSGGRTNTDISETSEDYVTANTSTETGTTTGTSATTSSWSRPPQTSSAAASAPASTTATAAEGSSFESASSIYSLARSEAVIEEPCSPPPILEEIPFGLELPPPTMRSSSSSSSGSYDLKDAMVDPNNDLEQVAPRSGHTSETELDRDEGHRSSSGGYAESPPDVRMWSEEERRRKKKTFSLDFLGATSSNVELEHAAEPAYPENVEVSPTPSHRHRSRSKPTLTRSPHRNNKKRDAVQQPAQQQQQQTLRSPQKEEWRLEQTEDGPHALTSDDSSCSHHYHMHHHHHHHAHREGAESGRVHRRIRESPRRKTTGYISTRRRSTTEDKNAAITGSLPRRKSRVADDIVCSSRLSPGRYQRSPGHNGQRALVIDAQSPEARLKAMSAESLRSASPGSDSVFYSESADQACISIAALDAAHCHHCGREVSEEIVRPPAGFADSPEGHRTTSKHVTGHRLYKKFDKRYRSEDRGDRRHRRSSAGRSDIRAKSEERATHQPGSRGSIDDTGRRKLQARSTDASLEILTGREDEDTYVEPYLSSEWIYIGDLEESLVWKRPDSRDGDDLEESVHKKRRDSQESTESEKNFKKRYEVATHRMVHRKSSGEMYKRIQTNRLKSDKRVVVKREAGGEFGFRIHSSKPVVVSAIEPDTPAENSGLEIGDIIMSVCGMNVLDFTHSEIVKLAHTGPDVLELEVARTCNVLAPRLAEKKESTEEAPLCSGYLWRKSTSSMEKWVRRWFALRRDNCLYCYKTDSDSQPVGAVMLLKYDVEQTPELRVHGFAIKKKGAPTLRLAADTEEAANRWITVIREAVERNNQIDTWLDSSLKMREMAAWTIPRPDCFGYLYKQQDHARKTCSPTGWSKRYCVLKDAALYFYDDANAEKAFGVACLHGFRVCSAPRTSGGRKHAFDLQPPDPTQRSYVFASDSEMDKKRWVAALEYSIDRWIKIG
ncbi:PREDICTED: uncharacterized protein LOC105455556 isoform X2 [Wasmannia auropunctata]|uniref:uncharacterized protein LOC105455556 isoform X2 n=1 Tax=Wasmannia auropunctata TaxID=64793 RepID=UPI0005EF5CDA|nr:PREDICTED: uncharacterized protein LOC105455556 isoform X2 [Wasmannia auropunctata]